MKPSYGTALGIGAALGLVVSMAALLFVGATGAVSTMDVVGEGSGIEPAFAVPASALWIVVLITGAVGGLVLALATRAVARVIDPEANSASSILVGPIGIVVGGVVAMAVFPLGVTILGSLADGVATITVLQMILLAAIVGVAAGGAIVWLSYVMSRPPQSSEDPELLTA